MYVLLADKKVYTAFAFNTDIGRQLGNPWYVPYYVYSKPKYETFAIGSLFLLMLLIYKRHNLGWGFLLTGKNSVKDFLNALRNKTPFLTSENYRRLPDDTIQTGEVRVLANISIQNVGGFSLGVSNFRKK